MRTYNNSSYILYAPLAHILAWRLEADTILVNIADLSVFRSSQLILLLATFPLFVVKSVRVSAVEATYPANPARIFSPFELRLHNISRP